MSIGSFGAYGLYGNDPLHNQQQSLSNNELAQYSQQVSGGIYNSPTLQDYTALGQAIQFNRYSSENLDALRYAFGGGVFPPEPGKKPIKAKIKNFISQLRAEIDDWHGDVLMRLEHQS